MYFTIGLISVIGFCLGVLMFGAGSMSDAPEQGQWNAQWGVMISLSSIVLIIIDCLAHHFHWLSGL